MPAGGCQRNVRWGANPCKIVVSAKCNPLRSAPEGYVFRGIPDTRVGLVNEVRHFTRIVIRRLVVETFAVCRGTPSSWTVRRSDEIGSEKSWSAVRLRGTRDDHRWGSS